MNVTEKLLLWGYVSAKASDLRVASSEQISSKSNTCIEKIRMGKKLGQNVVAGESLIASE